MQSRNLFSVRQLASAAMMAGLISFSLASAVQADDVTVDADYSASLSGFPIANGSLRFKLSGSTYEARLSAQVSGLAALVASRQATGAASGHAEPGHISPESYSLSISGGQTVNEVAEQFIDNKVVALAATELNIPGWDQRVPLLPSHKVGVVDPLGAFILPMRPNKDPLTPDACNRTLKIFDGRVRYDLKLIYGAKSDITGDAGSYSGPAIICAVAYRPIAGQRILSPEQQKFERNIEFSIWFVPVGSTGILLPHRILIETQSGVLIVNASRFVVHGSDPIVVASGKTPSPDSFLARHKHYRRHKQDPADKPETKLDGETKPAPAAN
jgi:hypothetical protein